jgi:hypothetical protein
MDWRLFIALSISYWTGVFVGHYRPVEKVEDEKEHVNYWKGDR